jgi:aspartate aminotransferase
MSKLQGQETSCVNSIAQKAAVEALTGDQSFRVEMKKTFKRRRDLMFSLLDDIPGISCTIPDGAFYAFPDFSKYLGTHFNGKVFNSSTQLSQFILETSKVVTVPGEGFGAPGHIRFSYAISSDFIKEGIKRVKQALKKLKY